MSAPQLVPGRSCEGCAMCCKLPEIKALEKPAGVWCQHCSSHNHCDIYLDRPEACRQFFCAYMTEAGIPENWKPLTSRMMITHSSDGNHLFVHVDPSRPDAWRKPPYLQELKQWARMNNAQGQQIFVSIGARSIVIFPDREVDLGIIAPDETLRFEVVQTPSGPMTNVHKTKTSI